MHCTIQCAKVTGSGFHSKGFGSNKFIIKQILHKHCFFFVEGMGKVHSNSGHYKLQYTIHMIFFLLNNLIVLELSVSLLLFNFFFIFFH